MLESFSSVDSSRTTPAEWLLARLTDPTRASAIMGDLTEMAATRSRLWFWTAYARTLVTLGWRAPVAFVIAYTCARSYGLYKSLYASMHWLFHWLPNIGTPYRISFWTGFWHVPLQFSLLALWFMLPFILVRFGLRDRLTQLAFAIFLLTVPIFSLTRVGMDFAGLATAIMIVTGLSLRTWRRPMIVLTATLAPLAARGFVVSEQLERILVLNFKLEICTAAIVCSFLHRRLLQKKPTGLRNIA